MRELISKMFDGNLSFMPYEIPDLMFKLAPKRSYIINFATKNEFREARINQLVDVSFEDKKAEDIIRILAFSAGSEPEFKKHDPSWLQEKITVEMLNTTLMAALDSLVRSLNGKISYGDAGDKYNITVEGRIGDPVTLPTTSTTTRSGRTTATTSRTTTGSYPEPWSATQTTTGTRISSEPMATTRGTVATSRTVGATPRPVLGTTNEGYVGKISIPMDDGSYFIEFMLRETDLSEELKKLRNEKIQEVIQKLQQSLEKD